MGKEYIRGWFELTIPDKPAAHYIAQAYDIEDARREFGIISEGHGILQLTWGELSRLTGCVIPSMVNGDDYAIGDIMLQYGGSQVFFCRRT